MKELIYHPAYKLINKLNNRNNGNNIVIDYVILQNDNPNCGIEEHKQAAINAMEIISERYNNRYKYIILIDEAKMRGVSYSTDELFEDRIEAPYQHSFLDPPYGSELKKEDFWHVNNMLFSNIYNLEIYDWCSGINWDLTDAYWEYKWSNYFDNGLEWWGVIFFTVYDKVTEQFTVIAASETD